MIAAAQARFLARPWLRCLLLLLVLAAQYGVIRWVHAPPDAAQLPDLTWRMQPLRPQGPERPVHGAQDWRHTQPQLRALRLVAQLDMAQPPQREWALFLPDGSFDAALTVNDTAFGHAGADNPYSPQFFRIPAGMLHAGANRIQLDLAGGEGPGPFLDRVWLGPRETLYHAFIWRKAWKTTYPMVLAVGLAILGGVSLALWLGRRHERLYLWQVICYYGVGLHALTVAGTFSALPPELVEGVRVASSSAAIAAATLFSLLFLDDRGAGARSMQRWLPSATVALVALVVGAAALLPRAFHAAAPWLEAGVMFYLYPGFLYLPWLVRGANGATFWMAVSAACIVAVLLHDSLMVLGLLPPYDGYWMHFAGPLPVVVFSWVLLQRVQVALTQSEQLNRELEARVQAKAAELEASYQAREEAERARAVAEERGRILMDMHDGIGGRLVSTLARLDNAGQAASDVAQSVREALADLRLIIYSIEPSAQSLCGAMALARDRLAPACEGAGLHARWNLDGLPDEFSLGPRNTLQLLRLVQEAVTNALKHAGASRLDVHAALRDGRLRVEIADNGCGLPPAPGRGHGLDNMRRRARQLGGELSLAPNAPGLRVRLDCPTNI